MRVLIDNFYEEKLETSIGKRVLKCEDNIFGWVKNLTSKQINFNIPIVLCLGGAGVNDDRSANGFAKIAQCILGRDGLEDGKIQLLGVKYPNNLDRLHIERVNFKHGKKRKVSEYIYGIYYTVLRPALFDKNDNIKDLENIKSTLRNITIFSHCHGSFVACEIVNYLKNDMLAVGISNDDVKSCLNEISNIMISPREGTHRDEGSLKIGFTLASDNLEGGISFPPKKNTETSIYNFCNKILNDKIKGSSNLYTKYGYLHNFFSSDTFGSDIKFVEDKYSDFGKENAYESIYNQIFIETTFHLADYYCFPLKKSIEPDVGYLIKNEIGVNFSNLIIKALQNSVSLSLMNKKRTLENVISNDTEIVFSKGDKNKCLYYYDIHFNGNIEEFSNNFKKAFHITENKMKTLISNQKIAISNKKVR